jgi:hypothetical protein
MFDVHVRISSPAMITLPFYEELPYEDLEKVIESVLLGIYGIPRYSWSIQLV